MQKGEKFTPSQSEKCFTQKEWISILPEWNFTLIRMISHPFHSFKSEFSPFLESDHSSHSFSSDFFYVYWNLNLFTEKEWFEWSLSKKTEKFTLERVKFHVIRVKWVRYHSYKSLVRVKFTFFEWNIFHSEKEWTFHFAFREYTSEFKIPGCYFRSIRYQRA